MRVSLRVGNDPQNRTIDVNLPAGWERVGRPELDADVCLCCTWMNALTHEYLQVIVTAQVEADGKVWEHISAVRRKTVPTYNDLVRIKKEFAGPDAKAIMVLPPEKEHVNIHPNCLHLFVPLEADPLPDFRLGIGKDML